MEKKGKNVKKLKNVLLFRHLTLEIFNRGVFLPITMTPKYSTTVPNSVNHTQDFMCIKFKALLPCKLHPISYDLCMLGILSSDLIFYRELKFVSGSQNLIIVNIVRAAVRNKTEIF